MNHQPRNRISSTRHSGIIDHSEQGLETAVKMLFEAFVSKKSENKLRAYRVEAEIRVMPRADGTLRIMRGINSQEFDSLRHAFLVELLGRDALEVRPHTREYCTAIVTPALLAQAVDTLATRYGLRDASIARTTRESGRA